MLTDTSLSEGVIPVKELAKGRDWYGRIFFDVPLGSEIKDVVFTEGLTGPVLGKWSAVKQLPDTTTGQASNNDLPPR